MYPNAEIPVLQFSLKSNLNPEEHYKAGEALAALRDEGVLIMASGLSYHNLRAFGESYGPISEAFESWLTESVTSPEQTRHERLNQWTQAPGARLAHPREDHLIPLMVAAGAAGADQGKLLFKDKVWGIAMSSYIFS